MATQSSAQGFSTPSESYIGSFVTLITNSDIRYEGILSHLNLQDSTIGLNQVRVYGTEGRRKYGPQVPPIDWVYEFILYRGSDIKDLQIKFPSTSVREEEKLFSDPAVIQYFGVQSSPVASVSGRSLIGSTPGQDSPATSSKALPSGFSSHQSVTAQVANNPTFPAYQSAATQVANHQIFPASMYRQGHSGLSSNNPHSFVQFGSINPLSMVSPLGMQNQIQDVELQAPASAATTSLLNSAGSPSPTSLKNSDSRVMPSRLSTTSVPYYPVSMTTDVSNMPLFNSPLQDINSAEGRMSGHMFPHPSPIYPPHPVHNSGSSFVDPTLGGLTMPTPQSLNPNGNDMGSLPPTSSGSSFVDPTLGLLPTPQSLVTSSQFAPPREQLLTHNLDPNRKDMGSLPLTSSGSSVPLWAQPDSVQQFTEDFDFAAMNEKFKKDEVWGSFGKETTKIEVVADADSGDKECEDQSASKKKNNTVGRNWNIKKVLEYSDIDSQQGRLFLNKKLAKQFVLPVLDAEAARTKDGVKVQVLDVDTNSIHSLVFKIWNSTEGHVFTKYWQKDFVERRGLKEKDKIALNWDGQNNRFDFSVLQEDTH